MCTNAHLTLNFNDNEENHQETLYIWSYAKEDRNYDLTGFHVMKMSKFD